MINSDDVEDTRLAEKSKAFLDFSDSSTATNTLFINLYFIVYAFFGIQRYTKNLFYSDTASSLVNLFNIKFWFNIKKIKDY